MIKKQIIKKIQVDDNIIIVIEGIVKSQHKSHYQAYKNYQLVDTAKQGKRFYKND